MKSPTRKEAWNGDVRAKSSTIDRARESGRLPEPRRCRTALGGRADRGAGVLACNGLLAIFCGARVTLEWPMALGFSNFAFKDTGSFRYVNSLLEMGLRPSVDFASFPL